MTVYYLDTSALVKRYARENGSSWVLRLTDPAAGHDVYTVRIAGPEMVAAIFRKARTGQISLDEAKRAAGNFQVDWQRQYQIVEVTVGVADLAMSLAERHGLRGYDAVHLAAALLLEEMRRSMQLPALVFVSADDAQIQVAKDEGLPVENPNLHL